MSATPVALIDEPLPRTIRRLAFPAMAAMLLRYANHAVDQYWVGRLPYAADALAAVSSAGFLIWAIYGLSALFTVGLQALVARAVGAGDPEQHASAVRHGLALATWLGFAVAALGLVATDCVLRFQGLTPRVQELGHDYLAVIFLGLPVSYVGMALGTVFRAEGDTVTPFRVSLLSLVLNAWLDPYLINGWRGLPALGVRGSAIVTVFVQVVGLLVLVWLHRRRYADGLPVSLSAASAWRLLRVGAPVAGAGLLFSLVYVVMVRILAPFGAAPVAALGLGHTIEGLPHFVIVGFGQATATLVGQNLGAGRPDEAARAARGVLAQLLLTVVPLAIPLIWWPEWLLSLFMKPPDPEVLAHGAAYLRVAGAVLVFQAIELNFWNALSGAGETAIPTLFDIVIQLCRLPLAAWLAHGLGLGPVGVWYSIGLMTIVGAVAMSGLFRHGAWRRREL